MSRKVRVVVDLVYEEESGDTELVKRIGEDIHFARFEHGLFYVRGTEQRSCEVSVEELQEDSTECACKGLGWTPRYCSCAYGRKLAR